MKTLKLTSLFFMIALAFGACSKEGCTDSSADNYDPEADESDGSCEYSGCTDETAVNFDEIATIDDGSCEYAGCTDEDAKNYDPEAVVSDGSCEYEGSIVFWWTQATSESMTNQNINSLELYLDDNLITTYSTSPHWAEAPACTEANTMSRDRDLGPAKLIEVSYRFVEPNSGQAIFNGNISYSANSCESLELTR